MTDEIVGVAAVLNASRLVSLEGNWTVKYRLKSFLGILSNYHAKLDSRIAAISQLWIELNAIAPQ